MASENNNTSDIEEEARDRAREALEEQEFKEFPRSWLNNHHHHHQDEMPSPSPPPSKQCQFFDHEGFLHLPSFCSPAECEEMKICMARIVQEEWDPSFVDSFGTDSGSNMERGDYFLESASRVHHFCEPEALDENGALKPEYQHDNKIEALNKSGHALHLAPTIHTRTAADVETNDDATANQRQLLPNNPFHSYCRSPKIRELVRDLGWRDPVVPQSMYIYKQAHHGGVVNSHQDSTFLFTTPRQSCLGLWLALDKATLDNGCLWVRPRSHRESVRRQYCRNVDHFGAEAIERRSNVAGGDTDKPKFSLNELPQANSVPWDGSLPGDDVSSLLQAGFVPVECESGDLLVFNGELDHLSLPNRSNEARHTFQLHMVEGPDAGVTWSPYNWLQYPDGTPFMKLNE